MTRQGLTTLELWEDAMRRCFLSICVLLSLATALCADQVTLKNGDRLSGKIVSSDEKGLLLKSEFAGDVTIQWGAIIGIESTQKITLTLKDGTRLSGKVTTQDGKFVVEDEKTAAASAPAPKDVIVTVRNDEEQQKYDMEMGRMAHPKFYYFWSGLIDTGLALTRGNSETASYNVAMKAVRETPRDKLTIFGTYIFANNSSIPPTVTTANSLDTGVLGDWNFSPRGFVFALADFQTNELQHLDLRKVFGGGLGYHVIKTPDTTFDIFGGATYDRDSFGAYQLTNPTPPPAFTLVPEDVKDSGEGLFGEEFDKKFSKRTTLTERFSFYPNLTSTGDYRFQLDANVATQLNSWLSWHVTLSDRYISYPPVGLKADDLLLSTGLRVSWGKAKL